MLHLAFAAAARVDPQAADPALAATGVPAARAEAAMGVQVGPGEGAPVARVAMGVLGGGMGVQVQGGRMGGLDRAAMGRHPGMERRHDSRTQVACESVASRVHTFKQCALELLLANVKDWSLWSARLETTIMAFM